jgi:hypothetical protein
MSKRSVSTSLAMLAAMAMMGGVQLPTPKPPKIKKPKPEYSDEDIEELDRLFQDRSSPGRKKFKKFQAQLRIKYAQAGK